MPCLCAIIIIFLYNFFMNKIYADEIYKNNKTYLAFIILDSQTRDKIYASIVRIIKSHEKDTSSKSLLLSELKSNKLSKTRYWAKIQSVLDDLIDVVLTFEISCTPKNKAQFQKEYAEVINKVYTMYQMPIIVDIINNKSFMDVINERVLKQEHFIPMSSQSEKGIQIADLVASANYNKTNNAISFNVNNITDESINIFHKFVKSMFKK